jgi:hypothetical protein
MDKHYEYTDNVQLRLWFKVIWPLTFDVIDQQEELLKSRAILEDFNWLQAEQS